jgi:hypothetical protein
VLLFLFGFKLQSGASRNWHYGSDGWQGIILTLKLGWQRELRGLCKEEVAERWGVARWVCAQYSELGNFVIARVGVEDMWNEVAGIEVAGKD